MSEQEVVEWARSRRWFYRYALPGGEWTLPPDPARDALHENRCAMLMDTLRARFSDRLASRRAIDLACHQGYFSIAMAREVGHVTGLDVNNESLADALRIARLLGIENVDFVSGDVQAVDAHQITASDIVLMYGLIYHVEDPLRLLRRAASWCLDTLVIETQLTPFDIEARIEWGASNHFRTVLGVYSLVEDQANAEGGVTDFALVPSLGALKKFLPALGFSRVEVVLPPNEGAEQLTRGSRAVVVAHR